ncbi:hypothetical protein QYF36_002242 [Acer negundo]|nr:hypothetical protein QYF36_002242 [Acer negundo]
MAPELQKRTLAVESGFDSSQFDDDGHVKRTGTLLTASAHIITAVIGSGVLSLAWALAQLGWIAGPIALIAFSIITWFNSTLLADSYRAVKRSNCFHKNGHEAGCHTSNNMFMTIFGVTQIILSQIPNFHELSGLSIIAAIMSFAYSLIGLGLSLAQIAGGNTGKTSLTGVVVGVDVTSSEKLWGSFQAIGNIEFAYAFSTVLVEIQASDRQVFFIQDRLYMIEGDDTLKSSPPENQEMKKATLIGVSITTIFYTLCGTLGYAAFGNNAPGNFLTGFGFYEPFWLIDFANICIVVHLVGAYQPTMAGKQNHKRIHVPVDMENTLCDSNLCHRHAIPLLQQRSWIARSSFLLALDRVFSNRNVHFTGKDSEVFVCMDMAQSVERYVLGCFASCCCWFN